MNDAKPALVLITFVLLIALFAGGAMSGTDLTPDTPPAVSSNDSPGVYDLPSSSGGPVYSPCGTNYVVRSGDTLSCIARSCNVTVSDLLSANPSITNPHLIHPGQKLVIYYASLPPTAVKASATKAPAAAAPAAKTPAAKTPAAQATATKPAAAAAAANTPASDEASIPTTGLKPGGSFRVIIRGLPADTPTVIYIGKEGAEPGKVTERSTNKNGAISISVIIPKSAKAGEKWVITATTTTVPPITVTSAPFVIE